MALCGRLGVLAFTVLLMTGLVIGGGAVGSAAAQDDGPDIVVDGNGSGDYEKLRPALENASEGDTVLIRNGSYILGYDPIRINKTLTIRGAPADGQAGPADNAPYIRITATSGAPFMRVTPEGSGTVIEGVKIGGRSLSTDNTGILLDGGSLTIRDSQIGLATFRFGTRFSAVSPGLGPGETFRANNNTSRLRLVDNRVYRRGLPSRFPPRPEQVRLEIDFADFYSLQRLSVRGNQMRFADVRVLGRFRPAASSGIGQIVVEENRVRTSGRVSIMGITERIVVRRNNITSTENNRRARAEGDSGSGVFVDSKAKQSVDIEVINNSFRNLDQIGLQLNPGRGQLDAKVADNVITDVYEYGFDSDNVNGVTAGIRIEKDGSGFSNINLSDNRIAGVESGRGKYAIVVRRGDKQLRIENNSIERGPIGIQLRSKNRNLTATIVGNRLSNLRGGIRFGKVKPDDDIEMSIRRNLIDRAGFGIRFEQKNAGMEVAIERNQLSTLQTGVIFNFGAEPFPDGIVLRRNNFIDTSQFAVDNRNGDAVDARQNYWGASDGPDSPTRSLADPASGALANGTGGNLSENPSNEGVTNVRFDPFRADPVSITFDRPSDPETPETPDTPDTPTDEIPGGIPEPEFEYIGDAVPDAIDPGESVTVNVTIRNVGEAPGRFAGELTDGFETLATEGGQLAPGESANRSYNVTFDEASINQIFVDRVYIDRVRVRLPTPDELTRRHLEIEDAYATREVVTPGETYELVAVLNNTDDEAHEFSVTTKTFQSTGTSVTEPLNRTETYVLSANERRVVRYEATADAVEQPRGLTAFIARTNVGNITVVPESARPTGVTAAYATATSQTPGVDKNIKVVVQNGNNTRETTAVILTPPGVEPGTEAAVDQGKITFVTVAPGESRRVEIPVERLSSDEVPHTWLVDGQRVPVIGVDARQAPTPSAVLAEAIEREETETDEEEGEEP